MDAKTRQEVDQSPRMKTVITSMLRDTLAAIDWAEQTYGIKIELDQEILAWVGRVQ